MDIRVLTVILSTLIDIWIYIYGNKSILKKIFNYYINILTSVQYDISWRIDWVQYTWVQKKNLECAQFYSQEQIKWYELQKQKYRELVKITQIMEK